MDRLARLHQLWSWLPAFRAVAETEHLPTAAASLGVSAPALSRSIGLVEDRLGTKLFAREHRRLVLNAAGRALLDSLRDAMRLVDDGLDRALESEFRGPVQIAVASGAVGAFLAPALQAVVEQHPDLAPRLSRARFDAIALGLTSGSIDIALVEHPLSNPMLRTSALKTVRMHVYCGRASCLWKIARPSRAQILAEGFVVPGEDARDGWPSEIERRVALMCDSLALAVDLCARGPWLACLPESVEALSGGDHLRRLPFTPALRPVRIDAVIRKPAGGATQRAGKIEIVLAALFAAERR